ncbi:glutathione S-transferase [Actimicrobium sp. CCC2.4]|uniref:glutathione S-transferase n=1 Tax=Actimicrobium sp. CCC2.4 TaxID=3048606 RepID=UPI002AC9372C|nr:glutathione S-transferase [Actimicrobium sp. CCC2.4]MEB0134851.1 glutathione S-transferase [Actimicrobium sp. CCC2.4]WPX30783.1 glutathione S-transferase [Actimicrobium sp. CCC2.4]
MIKLAGFALSNYYNKAKLVLLEKNIPFQEELVWTDKSAALLVKSPFGKIPYIETADGPLCESQVIVDYLEQCYPLMPLLPSDLFAAAKLKELITVIELHLELVARELYAEAFFGGKVSEETKARTYKLLKRNVSAFARLARFEPYVGGAEFSLADCAALVHLPLVSIASRNVLGEDVLAGLPVRDYLTMLGQRPHVQRINTDRKINQDLMAKRSVKPA